MMKCNSSSRISRTEPTRTDPLDGDVGRNTAEWSRILKVGAVAGYPGWSRLSTRTGSSQRAATRRSGAGPRPDATHRTLGARLSDTRGN